MAIHHQPSDGALPSGIPRYQWTGTCSVYPHMYPQQNHIYQRPMIAGTQAFSSNDPGPPNSCPDLSQTVCETPKKPASCGLSCFWAFVNTPPQHYAPRICLLAGALQGNRATQRPFQGVLPMDWMEFLPAVSLQRRGSVCL